MRWDSTPSTTRALSQSKTQSKRFSFGYKVFRIFTDFRCGLVFFGTPYTSGKDALVDLGRISAGIINLLSRSPPNDIMEAVNGSL
jgi:hypothetical protein